MRRTRVRARRIGTTTRGTRIGTLVCAPPVTTEERHKLMQAATANCIGHLKVISGLQPASANKLRGSQNDE